MLCVSIHSRLTSNKKSWNWPRNCFFWDEAKVIVETTFPSLMAWLQFVKSCSRRICHFFCDANVFWQIENEGNTAKKPLKKWYHRKNCTKKPINSLRTMPKPWKMVPQSAFPMGERTLFRGFGGLSFANWGEIGQKLKRPISLFDQTRRRRVLTNWCWYA